LMQWVDRRFRSDMFLRFALSFETVGDLQGRSVLDIGCGSGPYVLEALKRGASSVTALDPAPNMLALVRSRLEGAGFSERCSLVQGFFPHPSLNTHDHAIVMGVMDYVADAGAFLAELKPLFRVSAVISFPSRHWFRSPLRQVRYRMRNCPLYLYREQEVKDLCLRAGYKNVLVQKIPGAGMDFHVCLKV